MRSATSSCAFAIPLGPMVAYGPRLLGKDRDVGRRFMVAFLKAVRALASLSFSFLFCSSCARVANFMADT